MSILGGDGNINEVLELSSVDAGCACILLTPAKETVLCAAIVVSILRYLSLKRQESRQTHSLSVFFCLSIAFGVFLSFILSCLSLLLSLSICINTFSLIAFFHISRCHSPFFFLPVLTLACPCFFFYYLPVSHSNLS